MPGGSTPEWLIAILRWLADAVEQLPSGISFPLG